MSVIVVVFVFSTTIASAYCRTALYTQFFRDISLLSNIKVHFCPFGLPHSFVTTTTTVFVCDWIVRVRSIPYRLANTSLNIVLATVLR